MMVKKLTRIGSSLGLVIERSILDLLDIDKDTALEVRTDGDALIIRPIRSASDDDVLRVARRVMDVHAEALAKLAK